MLDHYNAMFANWAASLGVNGEFLLRLCLATLAGSLVGLEREMRGRLAGFRTHLLVCLGSALVMMVSISFAYVQWPEHNNHDIRIDPSRIAYGVMTGIGFLGAGTIMQSRGGIRGLTTAAALWCVAAIGLTIGLGLYLLGAMGTILVVTALSILDQFESLIPKPVYRRVVIRRPWAGLCVAETVARMRELGFRVVSTAFERNADLVTVDITLSLSSRKRSDFHLLEQSMTDPASMDLIAIKE